MQINQEGEVEQRLGLRIVKYYWNGPKLCMPAPCEYSKWLKRSKFWWVLNIHSPQVVSWHLASVSMSRVSCKCNFSPIAFESSEKVTSSLFRQPVRPTDGLIVATSGQSKSDAYWWLLVGKPNFQSGNFRSHWAIMANLHIDGHSNIHWLVGSEHYGCNINSLCDNARL